MQVTVFAFKVTTFIKKMSEIKSFALSMVVDSSYLERSELEMRLLIKAVEILVLLICFQVFFPHLVRAKSSIPKHSPSFFEIFLLQPWWVHGLLLLFMIGCVYYVLKWMKKRRKGGAAPIVQVDDVPITVQRQSPAVIPGNAQTIGSREEQQDAFGFSDIGDGEFTEKWGVLAVVADGMGGLQGGKEVSHIAVQSFLEHYVQSYELKSIPEKLVASLERANMAVLDYADKHRLMGRVGTTLIAAVIFQNELFWLSVGDSRIYHNNGEHITQLTTEHKYAKELDDMVAQGLLTAEEALLDPQRESLTSFIGLEKIEQIDLSLQSLPLEKGDSIILCSDGLYGTLSDEEIREVCQYLPTQEAAEELIKLVLTKKRPHQDNATVAILTVE